MANDVAIPGSKFRQIVITDFSYMKDLREVANERLNKGACTSFSIETFEHAFITKETLPGGEVITSIVLTREGQ